MFKVIALIVGGILLMTFGVYFLLNANLHFVFPYFQLPNINWGVVGFVSLAGSAAVFGTAAIASKLNR
jgi:hypothetical protein